MVAACTVEVSVVGHQGNPVAQRLLQLGPNLRQGRSRCPLLVGLQAGTSMALWLRKSSEFDLFCSDT